MTDSINKSTTPAYNITFAIGGASCFAESLVATQSIVLRINICSKNPAHRNSANRYHQIAFFKSL